MFSCSCWCSIVVRSENNHLGNCLQTFLGLCRCVRCSLPFLVSCPLSDNVSSIIFHSRIHRCLLCACLARFSFPLHLYRFSSFLFNENENSFIFKKCFFKMIQFPIRSLVWKVRRDRKRSSSSIRAKDNGMSFLSKTSISHRCEYLTSIERNEHFGLLSSMKRFKYSSRSTSVALDGLLFRWKRGQE